MSTVLVTGASGMVGGGLVEMLVQRRESVRVLVRPTSRTSTLERLPAEIVRADLGDPAALARAVEGCARVYHVAGLVSYRRADAERLYQTNVAGTHNLLAAALDAGVRRVVLTSSTAAVGLSEDGRVLDEAAPFDAGYARFPYMWTKHLAEVEAAEAVALGLDVVIVNPSTILGAGDVHLNTGRLFRQIAAGKVKAAPPGGNAVVALTDVVQGHLLAMERGRTGRRYILSAANLAHVELLGRIACALGRPPIRRVLPRWTEGPASLLAGLASWGGDAALTPQVVRFSYRYRYFRADRARSELGWVPATTVEDAIGNAARWYAAHGVLKAADTGKAC